MIHFTGNARKKKHHRPLSATAARCLKGVSQLSTDEVLERIQQQMEEVMASAQEVANSAVTNENEARQVRETRILCLFVVYP